MARTLAHVEVIESLIPIHGKDRIVLANLKGLGWSVIVNKADYAVGDLCVYCEIDSILPSDNKEFAFLEKKKYRIKTMKMGGVLSQGICFPMSILPKKNYSVGNDVTKVLKITQYEAEMDNDKGTTAAKPKSWNPFVRWNQTRLAKKKAGWPHEIAKTDETRIENMPWILQDKETKFIATEKLDGCSATYMLRRTKSRFLRREKFEYIVCSRNLRLFGVDNSIYWKVSDKYKIEAALRNMIGDREWVAIQGECLSPNVQKNRYKVENGDVKFYIFNIKIPGAFYDSMTAASIAESRGLDFVPIIASDYILPDTIEELRAFTHGESILHPTLREGMVFRPLSNKVSFKCVDPEFLLSL